MFRKFNLQKKIELTCPYCGHRQEEPARVISSFCRACSEHFRVQKGIAIRNPGMRISGIAEVLPSPSRSKAVPQPTPPSDGDTVDPEKEETWLMSAEDDEGAPRPLPRDDEEEPEEPAGISAGAFFGLVSEEEAGAAEDSPRGIGEKAQSKEVLAEGSMAALIEAQALPSLPEKGKMPPNYKEPEKRRKSGDQSSDLEVRCFRCYHVQHVSRFAKSTQCERCSVYISLANYEVSTNQSHTLRTRGDITIGKRGGLKKCEVACHNLTVHGSIDAVVDCSGLAVFRRSGIVRGPVHCRKLVVEKTASIEFPDGILTEQADILGTVRGNITCSGTVRVAKSALVEGDIRAVSIDIKDGATVSGETTNDPDVKTDLPVKMGFNPSVIG